MMFYKHVSVVSGRVQQRASGADPDTIRSILERHDKQMFLLDDWSH